jgi:hypothetical protein
MFVAATQAADVAATPMMLTAYVNGAGGESLISGQYDAAIAQLKQDRPNGATAYSAKMNNLCVAYTITKQLTDAKAACTAAVKAAKYDRLSSQRYAPGSSRENAYVAIAYANRAVAAMLAQDSVSAKSDLERARSLAPSAEFVSRNMAAAQTKSSTIAKLDVAPAR